MNKNNLIPVVLILSLIAPGLAFAQENNRPTDTPIIRKEAQQRVQNLRQDLNQDAKAIRVQTQGEKKEILEEAKNVREEARDKIQAVREEVKAVIQAKQLAPEVLKEFQAKQGAIRAELKTRQEEFRKTFEAKREEAKQQLETRREEFKKSIETVRDERKKQVAERIFSDVNSLNAKAVENLKKATDQIEEVLNRVFSRAEKAAANGNDIIGVTAAGESAKTAIREARAAIETQVSKTYSVAVSSEEILRANLKQIRDQLHFNLEAVKNKVKAARDAVRVTAVTLAQIPKVDELEVSSQPATSMESAAPGIPQ